MASTKAIENAGTFYEKNKGVVDGIMKSLVEVNNNKADKMFGAQTAAKITNKTQAPLIFSASKDWSGKVKEPYPTIIGDVAQFVHASDHPGHLGQSDKAAVVYATNKSNYGWLLAWSVSAYNEAGETPNNKVYVEAGPVENLTKWDEIKVKLEASSNESYFGDRIEGVVMYAKINPVGSYAELAALYIKE